MYQPNLEKNPEFAFYQKRLQRNRSRKRIQGYLYLTEAVAMFVLICVASINLLPDNPDLYIPLLVFMCLGICLLIFGIVTVRRGYQPISDREIAHQRSSERKQLFRYAQGAIPWRYRLLMTVIELLVGIFFTGMGVFAFVVFFMQLSSYGFLIYVPSLLAGVYFLFDAFKRANMARQLAHLSSRELASRLELGEVTEGQ